MASRKPTITLELPGFSIVKSKISTRQECQLGYLLDMHTLDITVLIDPSMTLLMKRLEYFRWS